MESLGLQRTMNKKVPPREWNSDLKKELNSTSMAEGPHGSAPYVISQW